MKILLFILFPLILLAQYIGTDGYGGFITESTAWTPTDISGCVLWLDATDASTLTTSGSTVTAWADKSGNSYNIDNYSATPETGTRTINGHNTIDFVNLDNDVLYRNDLMGFSGNPAMTIIIVLDSDATNGRAFFIGGGIGGQGLACRTDGSYRYNNGYQLFSAVGTDPIITMWWRESGATYSDGHLSYDNVEESQTAGGAATTITLKANHTAIGVGESSAETLTQDYYDGAIGEVLVYDSALSEADRTTLYNYLKDKWGL